MLDAEKSITLDLSVTEIQKVRLFARTDDGYGYVIMPLAREPMSTSQARKRVPRLKLSPVERRRDINTKERQALTRILAQPNA